MQDPVREAPAVSAPLDTQRSLEEARLALAEALRARPVPLQPLPERAAAQRPEVWSAGLSLLGALLALPAAAGLLVPALRAGSVVHGLSFAVYGFGMVAMFLASALFHSRAGEERGWLKNLDYCAIALMIAGTITPYCTIALGGTLGACALAGVWLAALAAIVLRLARPALPKWVLISFFLAMGWIGGMVVLPSAGVLGRAGVALTLLGGLVYSVGTVVFNRNEDDVEPPGFGAHEVWHLFILGGAASHYLAILLFLAPA
ncbi:MAG: hemolysin III family protein [Elusimicrobia bacterium]|nr:hemolysin III family protein [Elusimicrobiota bacterium]